MRVKRGDTVLVIAGDDKGKRGKVVQVRDGGKKLIVEGINLVWKHQRPIRRASEAGRIQKSAPIDRSNVMVVCPHCDKPTRGRTKFLDGRKVRSCHRCQEPLDVV
ncbi:MAG: 50S ribosomal protein L24 [Armatimonadetes bacterium]|nr:50S ribosomal protein L24 [Armatimonadota bacterium]MDW8121170.1 50S ribosomal protein L24 [Armatimonadota bacterium]